MSGEDYRRAILGGRDEADIPSTVSDIADELFAGDPEALAHAAGVPPESVEWQAAIERRGTIDYSQLSITEIRDNLYGGDTRRMAADVGLSARSIYRYIGTEQGTVRETRTPRPRDRARIEDAAGAEHRRQRNAIDNAGQAANRRNILQPIIDAGGATVDIDGSIRISDDEKWVSFPSMELDLAQLGMPSAINGDWADAWDDVQRAVLSDWFSGSTYDATDFSEITPDDIDIRPLE